MQVKNVGGNLLNYEGSKLLTTYIYIHFYKTNKYNK